MARNQLVKIDEETLTGLIRLETLSLTSNLLTYLKPNHFGQLSSLLNLDLQGNEIYSVDDEAFKYLKKLQSLNLRSNPLKRVQQSSFSSLMSLKHIYFPKFYMCSYALHVRVCEPKGDGISSVSHLLDNLILRISVWVVAVIACSGNVSVFVGRILVKEMNAVHSFYIKNLAVADFLMGLYLFIIAGHDMAFRDEYIRHDVQWRHSWQCSLAGIISTISSEASIFILTVITIDRYISILYPLNLRRRTYGFPQMCMTLCWFLSLLIALLPVIDVIHFDDQYYGNNGVCLPIQIHEPFSSGWKYSLVVFCGINSVAFVFIFYAYVKMFLTISRSSLGLRSSQQQQDRTIAKRFSFIVVTDLLCWFPIIVIKLLAVTGVEIDSKLYAWVAVFLLPINSALNPVLYTLTTKLFKQQIAKIVYTWRVSGIPQCARQVESYGISLSSILQNGRSIKNGFSVTSEDKTVSRSSLISANSSRSSERRNWPSPSAFIVYENSYF